MRMKTDTGNDPTSPPGSWENATKGYCKQRQTSCDMYGRMSAVLNPQRISTSMVIASNEDNEWTERTIKEDMEKATMVLEFCSPMCL
jgi:hypothetical protein